MTDIVKKVRIPKGLLLAALEGLLHGILMWTQQMRDEKKAETPTDTNTQTH